MSQPKKSATGPQPRAAGRGWPSNMSAAGSASSGSVEPEEGEIEEGEIDVVMYDAQAVSTTTVWIDDENSAVQGSAGHEGGHDGDVRMEESGSRYKNLERRMTLRDWRASCNVYGDAGFQRSLGNRKFDALQLGPMDDQGYTTIPDDAFKTVQKAWMFKAEQEALSAMRRRSDAASQQNYGREGHSRQPAMLEQRPNWLPYGIVVKDHRDGTKWIAVLDCFHEQGHPRCTPACVLGQDKDWNDELRRVNSSAAELGNSGILKIRCAVSYFTQRHAVILCPSIWNRTGLQK